jgi:hypothetical protein
LSLIHAVLALSTSTTVAAILQAEHLPQRLL